MWIRTRRVTSGTAAAAALATLPLALVLGSGPASAVGDAVTRSTGTLTGIATVSATPGALAPTFATPCYTGHQNCAEVHSVVQHGDVMYVGGSWTQAFAPRSSTPDTTHPSLLAFDRVTGAILPGFAGHTFNGMVRSIAVSPDGSRVYVGGDFTGLDCHQVGKSKVCTLAQHLVAFDGAGALAPSFSAAGAALTANGAATDPTAARGRVRHLELSPDGAHLYVAGDFSHLDGAAVSQLGVIDLPTGAVDTAFHPTFAATDQLPEVSWTTFGAALASPNGATVTGLYASGHFDTVDGVTRNTVVALDPTTGARLTGFNPTIQRQVTPYDPLQQGLQVLVAPATTSPATVLVAQGGHYNRGYRFSLAGALLWRVNTGGDVQAVALSGRAVYFGGHFICWSTNDTPILRADCNLVPPLAHTVVRVHLAVVDLATGKLDAGWAPLMNPNTVPPYYNGVWMLTVSAQGDLYVGGVFKQVDVGTAVYPSAKLAVFPALPAA